MRFANRIISTLGVLMVIALAATGAYYFLRPPAGVVPDIVEAPATMTGETTVAVPMPPEVQPFLAALGKAKDSLVSGQFQNALEASREVLKEDSENSEAAFISFLSARMQNLPPAHWRHLLKPVDSPYPLVGLDHTNSRVQRYALWYLRQLDVPPAHNEVQRKVIALYDNPQAARKVRQDAGSTLATWGNNEHIQILLKDLVEERTRYRAYTSLKSIPDSFLPDLAAMNQNLDPKLVPYTTCLLFILGKPSFLKDMIATAPEQIAALEDYVIPTDHPDFVKVAVSVGKPARELGRKLIEHRSYLVRATGASIMGSAGTEEDVQFLLQQLGKESGFHFVQGNIVEALGNLKAKPAVSPLILLAGARAPYLRERVILALAKLVDSESRGRVEKLLSSSDRRVREGAERILAIVDRHREQQKTSPEATLED